MRVEKKGQIVPKYFYENSLILVREHALYDSSPSYMCIPVLLLRIWYIFIKFPFAFENVYSFVFM